MALQRVTYVARTSSAGNPITQASVTVAARDTVVILLNVIGGTARAGGAPTLDGPMLQAGSTQIAAASPEASAEIWYALNVPAGTYTLTIPNTGAATIKYTVEGARSNISGRAALDSAAGANATAANPSPGALAISQAGDIAWAVVASGAQTWAPSARGGTQIADTDDGATGGGEQVSVGPAVGSLTLNWTFATSDDYGACAVAFKEVLPLKLNNYMGVRAGSGLSVTERIR